MALDFPGPRGRAAAHARGRRALQRRDRARRRSTCRSSRCPRAATRSTTSSSSARRASQRRYDKVTPELTRAAPVRAEDDPRDGLRRLLPDRLGLHPLREDERRSASAPAAARPPARSPRTASRSPTSTRCATGCSSSASSTRPASRHARHGHRLRGRRPRARHQLRAPRSTAATASRRSSPSRRWPPAPPSATRAACSRCPYGAVDRIAKLIPEGPGQTLDECLKPGGELQQAVRHRPASRRRSSTSRSRSKGSTRAGLDPRRRRRHRRRAADRRRAAAAEGRRPGGRDAVLDEATSRRSAC